MKDAQAAKGQRPHLIFAGIDDDRSNAGHTAEDLPYHVLRVENSAAMGPDSTPHAYTRLDIGSTAPPTMAYSQRLVFFLEVLLSCSDRDYLCFSL